MKNMENREIEFFRVEGHTGLTFGGTSGTWEDVRAKIAELKSYLQQLGENV